MMGIVEVVKSVAKLRLPHLGEPKIIEDQYGNVGLVWDCNLFIMITRREMEVNKSGQQMFNYADVKVGSIKAEIRNREIAGASPWQM
jgi:hypothetical protein